MVVQNRQQTARCRGHVHATRLLMTVTSDQGLAHYDKDGRIIDLTCTGNVRIVEKDRVATGDKAVYVEEKRTVDLTGHAVARQGDDVLTGEPLVFYVDEDRVVAKGASLLGKSTDLPQGHKADGGAAPAQSRPSALGDGDRNAAAFQLSAEGLLKSYHRRRVVDDVSFEVRAGEVVGLLGPNGAGKTTCFRMMVGLLKPQGGKIALDGRDVTRLPMHRRCRLGLGYLPQEPSIFRRLTVRENFLAILEVTGCPPAERESRTEALLAEFNLTAVRDGLGEALSGGERRRAEIARSLIPGPRFMLFDEPFAGVDPLAVGELQALIASLRQRGLGVLISDHNARETLTICDRAYLIADGKILEQGTPRDIAASPMARAVYLGESFRLN